MLTFSDFFRVFSGSFSSFGEAANGHITRSPASAKQGTYMCLLNSILLSEILNATPIVKEYFHYTDLLTGVILTSKKY